MDLEHHKEELNHWSDDAFESDDDDDESDENFYGETICECGCNYKDFEEEETEFSSGKEEQEMLF